MPTVRMFTYPFHALPEFALIGTAAFEAASTGLIEHEHGPCMEIVVFERGRNTYVADGVEYRLRGGDVFSSPPHQVHSSGGNPQDKARHAWLQINLAEPPARAKNAGARARANVSTPAEFLGILGGNQLRRRLAALPVLQTRALPALYPQLLDLYELVAAQAPGEHPGRAARLPKKSFDTPPVSNVQPAALFDLRTRLARFLIDFLSVAEPAAQAAHAGRAIQPAQGESSAVPISPLIAKALAHMQAHIAVPLSVTHIAQACSYSPSAFKQAFRMETGLTPADYFLRLKIDEAKRRLAANPVEVTTLAHDLGFSSGQYFATVFRRLTTLTPSAWRDRHRPA